ncbi:MAG: ABC transporter substrate-binding protein [Ardenticatenia bacterium]|nr:ABC transporter substrate-binding protein [Ardenticatenia bacterium]
MTTKPNARCTTALLLLAWLATMAACTRTSELPTIGVCQFISHPDLDIMRTGFVQALQDAGYEDGRNARIDYQNAEGDMATVQLINQKFVNQKVDVIAAIATPCLQGALQATQEIPIIFVGIDDPYGAGAGTTPEDHLPNVTGIAVAFKALGDAELALVREVLPDARSVGILWNPSEANSQAWMKYLRAKGPEMGLEIVEQTVAGSQEVLQAAQSLAAQEVSAIIQVADNTVASAFDAVIQVGDQGDIPIFPIFGNGAEMGASVSLPVDWYAAGYAAGEMAVRVLKGEDTARMPFQTASDVNLQVNLEAAERQGVRIPESVLQRADEVIGQ